MTLNNRMIEIPLLIVFLVVVCTNYAKATGSYVSIGSHRIFINVQGKKTDKSIIFVSGAGEDNATWNDVQPALSKYCLTMSYDRIGLGQSDSTGNYKKDAASMSWELFQVLKVSRMPAPYILVGHSIGCQIARIFAATYPSLVKSIVFIDPGFSELGLKARMPADVWDARAKAIKNSMPALSNAQQAELNDISLSCDEADKAQIKRNIKVILLTATKISKGFPGVGYEAKYKKASHQRWITQIPQAIHEFVPSSRHYIQNDAPGIVIEKVRSLARADRT